MTLDRKTLMIGAALVAALAVGFGAARLTQPAPEADSHAEAGGHSEDESEAFVRLTPQQAEAAGVRVVSLARGGGDVRLIGRVEAAAEARAAVGSPLAGSVQRLLTPVGSSVSVGSGLVAIRSADAASLVAEARAAEAEAEVARVTLAREERLMKEGVIARQDWEQARAAQARAAAAADAARARASAAGGPNAAGEIIIRSPIAGVVVGAPVSPGAFTAQGATVAEIADPGRVEVVFDAPAEAASELQVGQTLRISAPDGAETTAEIVGVAPLSQDTTGAAKIRARLISGRLPPGSAVSASVRTAGRTSLSVPSEAVQTLAGVKTVFVAEAGGFRPKPVTVGRTGAGYTEIVSGLSGRERIAGRGAFVLKAELAKAEAEHEH